MVTQLVVLLRLMSVSAAATAAAAAPAAAASVSSQHVAQQPDRSRKSKVFVTDGRDVPLTGVCVFFTRANTSKTITSENIHRVSHRVTAPAPTVWRQREVGQTAKKNCLNAFHFKLCAYVCVPAPVFPVAFFFFFLQATSDVYLFRIDSRFTIHAWGLGAVLRQSGFLNQIFACMQQFTNARLCSI